MKISKPLSKILDSEVKIDVLRFLCMTGAKWNGRQIAREIGITPATAHKALSSLNQEGVLLLHNIGKTHVYSLNENNFVVTDLLKPLFAKERAVLDKIIAIIRHKVSASSIKDDIVSVALFGSVNVQQDHAASDIDIALIAGSPKSKIKAEKLFEEIDRVVSVKFGNTIAPYINTKAEFKSKYKNKMAVIKNILKGHTIIFGKDLEEII